MNPFKRILIAFQLALFLLFYELNTVAQEKKTDINVSIGKGNNEAWYSHPWVWVIGAAVFILLLVAILRGGGNK